MQRNSEDSHEALSKSVTRWPTPHAALMNDGEDPESFRRRQAELRRRGINGNGAGVPLTIAAQEFTNEASEKWPSPCASQGKTFRPKSDGRQGLTLEGRVERWETPRAIYGDHRGMEDREHLTGQALWATPIGRDYKDSGMDPGAKTPTNAILGRQVLRTGLPSGPPVPLIGKDGRASLSDGPNSPRPQLRRPRLSPRFVSWLMGFPSPAWAEARAMTSSELTATRSALSRLALLCDSYTGD